MTNSNNDDVRLLKSNKDIWSEARVILEKKLSQPSFESWIRPAQLIEFSQGQATIAVSNEFMRGMFTNNYVDSVCDAISQVTGENVAIRVVVDASVKSETYTATIASISDEPNNTAQHDSQANHYLGNSNSGHGHNGHHLLGNQSSPPWATNSPQPVSTSARLPDSVLTARSNLNAKYLFETFVVGAHNRFSHSAALAVAQRPGQAYNPLFIYGGVGLGKTHIMHAIGHEILRHTPNASVRYISCEKFTNELINSIRDDRMSDFRKRYRQVDVLLVDDIQFLQGKESTQEEFFHTFNALRDSGRQIVLSSDRPPKAISHLEERLRSRFEWGLIADIQAPDLETRVAILRKKCEAENMRIDDEALEYIATVFTSNIRELEGALIRANAYCSLTGEALSIASLAGMLQPTVPGNKPKVTITADRIIQTVAAHFRVEPSELRSAKRSQDLALPRHVAMYLAHELIKMSFPRIGEAFGNRKHTSALYAHSRIKEALPKDPNLAQAVKQIQGQLAD
ncbi:MAG: chromosomal replication initiator protein DnaA [Candidatus Melainabacteria bacterium]|nr:chromosomal replication initiator protein DnaA [Candidatus Melainabacteria bacterium]